MRAVLGFRISDRSSGHENNFNLLRMIAALGVMVSHAVPLALGEGAPEPFQAFLKGDNLGRVCVFVFFAISGFFISQSYDRKRDPLAFLWARCLRIFPGLIVMLVLTTLAAGVWIASDRAAFFRGAPDFILYNATLFGRTFFGPDTPLGGIFQDNPYPNAFNGSLWTLPFEFRCYLGVLAAGLLGLLRRPRVFLALAALFLVLFLIREHVTGNWAVHMVFYIGLPFVFGATAYVLRDRIVLSPLVLLLLCAAVPLLRPTPLFLASFMLALSYGTLWLGFLDTPRLRAYNRLGDYSYGVYIYAFPIQQAAAHFGARTQFTNLAVAVPLTLLCAVLSWHIVEARALRFKSALRAIRTRPLAQPRP